MNDQKDCATCRPSSLERWGLALLGAAVVVTIVPSIVSTQPVAQVTPQTQQAMVDAINDEYRSRAFYSAVLQKFGEVRPFSNIVQAEDRHASLLKSLFTQYGLPIPADTFMGRMRVPSTLRAACQQGVAGETATVAMYDRFLSFVRRPDLRAAFSRLRQVSQERHLPAFLRCVGR